MYREPGVTKKTAEAAMLKWEQNIEFFKQILTAMHYLLLFLVQLSPLAMDAVIDLIAHPSFITYNHIVKILQQKTFLRKATTH